MSTVNVAETEKETQDGQGRTDESVVPGQGVGNCRG